MVERLTAIETYYDAVPRAAARAEEIGPFSLFVNPGPGWSFYARPSLGATRLRATDVQRVRARQRELGLHESFEWVAETTPTLADAAVESGLSVTCHPLMLLRTHLRVELDGVRIRLATENDDLALFNAIAQVAFNHAGTASGRAGLDAARQRVEHDPSSLAFQQERIRTGRTITAVANVDNEPVGVGSHQPIGSVTEVVGVGVLPSFRRRGIAAALTSHLVSEAAQRDVHTIFLSAGDETIGHVYERVGFERIGTACIAEPAAAT
jgi:ribosomal protein S18 acetylase RimI-like enzyme